MKASNPSILNNLSSPIDNYKKETIRVIKKMKSGKGE